jgi:hypothetical protein
MSARNEKEESKLVLSLPLHKASYQLNEVVKLHDRLAASGRVPEEFSALSRLRDETAALARFAESYQLDEETGPSATAAD